MRHDLPSTAGTEILPQQLQNLNPHTVGSFSERDYPTIRRNSGSEWSASKAAFRGN